MLKKLTEWFTAQIGVTESGNNNVKYNTAYYGREVNGSQYPWCMVFIWCGFRECGASALLLGGEKTAYCPYAVNWARQHGQWVTGGYREGDIVFFNWDGDSLADHVGYVLEDIAGVVHIIEGNAGNGEVKESHWRESSLMGAYRPEYGEEEPETEQETGNVREEEDGIRPPGGDVEPAACLTVSCEGGEGDGEPSPVSWPPMMENGCTGSAVLTVQVILVHKWGISVGNCGCDGEYGPDTEAAVRKFQRVRKLEEDGIVGPKTWKALIGG